MSPGKESQALYFPKRYVLEKNQKFKIKSMLTTDKLLAKAIKDQKAKTDYGCISVWKYAFLNIKKKKFKLYKEKIF